MDTQEPTIDDLIKALPVKEKVPVLALKKLLDQREAIDAEQEQKINEIKRKYSAMIQPLLQRVRIILNLGFRNYQGRGYQSRRSCQCRGVYERRRKGVGVPQRQSD